jgi:hypothetical protein
MNNRNVTQSVWQGLQALIKKTRNRADSWNIEKDTGEERCRIRIASDRATRERAYRLAYQVYRAERYVSEDPTGMLVCPFDARPETLTLLAEDHLARPVGTISLVFDSPAGLPCTEIYPKEWNQLRAEGGRLAEVVRLAVDKSHPHSKMLLIRMFNLISIFSRRVRRDTDFIIEVSPQHAQYYKHMLAFEQVGPERFCPRVNGTVGVLLRVRLSDMEKEIDMFAGHKSSPCGRRRSAYAYAYTLGEEGPVAKFMAKQHKPMTLADIQYFGLNRRPRGSGTDTMKLIMGAITEECFGTFQHSLMADRIKLA